MTLEDLDDYRYMITIELRLPTQSIIAFTTWCIAAAAAVLALIVSRSHYLTDSYRIPLYLLAGFLILGVISTLVLGIYPTNVVIIGANSFVTLSQIVVGCYWLGARLFAFEHSLEPPKHSALQMEVAVLVLWLVNLLISVCLQGYSIFHTFLQPRDAQHSKCSADSLDIRPKELSDHDYKKSLSSSLPSFNIDRSHTMGLKLPKKSRSTLDFKRVHRNHKSTPNLPSLAGLEAVPEGFLDNSWEMNGAENSVQYILSNLNGTPSIQQQSRNCSNSTQQSGLFSATDYNRRITSAGFIRDEPKPPSKMSGIQKKIRSEDGLRSKASFSHYDVEKMGISELL